jgi:branched-chain amino acid transport system substrate-binding protein
VKMAGKGGGMKKLILIGLLCSLFASTAFAEPVRIGVIFAKTGRAAGVGKDFFKAINLLVKDLNRSGGVLGRQIELLEFDNTSTPLGAKQAGMDALQADVVAVIGSSWSSNTKVIADIFQKEGIPLITPLATKPEITEVGSYIFRVCYTDPFQGKVMAKFARTDLSAKTAVVFTNVDSGFSQSLSSEFTHSFESLGGDVLASYDYLRSETDFSAEIEAIHRMQPDVVYLSGYARDSTLIILQCNKMDGHLQFLGGDGWGDGMYDFAGTEIDGNYYTSHWHPQNPNPISDKLQASYGNEKIKGARLVLAYDALMVLIDAIKWAQSTDRDAIRAALAGTVNFPGATGYISFNAKGDPMKPAVILRLENGSSSFIKAVTP